MTVKAAVKFELDSSLEDWTEFTSPEVVVAGFKLFLTGEYICCAAEDDIICSTRRANDSYDSLEESYTFNDTKFALLNAAVHCSLVERMENSIWSCEAEVAIVAFAESECSVTERTTVTHSKHWSQLFTFHNPESVAVKIDFHKKFSEVGIRYIEIDEERVFSKLELRVTVISRKMFDLCVPQNKMVKSPEDAAKVIVDGKPLWLSKEVLGGACPFFHAYFNNDFKEKRDGVFPLTDVKLDEFLRFAAIIYGVHIDIDETSLQYLLLLEDKYQCEVVRSKCHTFLVATDTLTNQEKLRIGDRFRFQDLIDRAIAKMNVRELVTVGRQIQTETYSHNTTTNILKAVSDRFSL